jgi:hypothetical protein
MKNIYGDIMKLFTIIITLIFFCGISNVQADQPKAIYSFNSIKGKFSNFFKTPQKLIYKQSYSASPTGINVEIIEYDCIEMSYDIQETKSLISPFIAYIDLDLTSISNSSCGNVSYTIGDSKTTTGWDSEKGALDNADIPSCYKRQMDITGSLEPISRETIRINFAFQNNKWVFKSAVRKKYNIPPLALSNAFGIIINPGIQLQDSTSIAYNSKWIELIK